MGEIIDAKPAKLRKRLEFILHTFGGSFILHTFEGSRWVFDLSGVGRGSGIGV